MNNNLSTRGIKTEGTELENITLQESSRLIELEQVVTKGLQSWIEVGEALIEIRDSRLYRVEFGTFEEYCQSKFKMGKAHAHRLMTAAPIAKDLSPMGDIPERAVREIAKVEPSKRQEVFDRAMETASGHVPTAREIKQVAEMEVKETVKPEPKTQTAPAPKKSGRGKYNHKVTFDLVGNIVGVEEVTDDIGSSPKGSITLFIGNDNLTLTGFALRGKIRTRVHAFVDRALKAIREEKKKEVAK